MLAVVVNRVGDGCQQFSTRQFEIARKKKSKRCWNCMKNDCEWYSIGRAHEWFFFYSLHFICNYHVLAFTYTCVLALSVWAICTREWQRNRLKWIDEKIFFYWRIRSTYICELWMVNGEWRIAYRKTNAECWMNILFWRKLAKKKEWKKIKCESSDRLSMILRVFTGRYIFTCYFSS